MNCAGCHLSEVTVTNTQGDRDKQEYGRSSDSYYENSFFYCTSCQEKHDNLYERPFIPTLEISQLATPIISSPSTESYASIYNECLADENSISRGYQDEGESEKCQEDIRNGLNIHLKSAVVSAAMDGDYVPIVEMGGKHNDDAPHIVGEVIPICDEADQQSFYGSYNNVSAPESEKIQVSEVPHFFDESEDKIWEPPEPEYIEDEVEGSVVNYDDEDEFGDGVEWNKHSSLGRLCENNRKMTLKEEKERTLRKVMNGKFKTFVSQLLKSLDVEPGGEENESWVDVVISLSWEAALFVKPDFSEGKTMDLDSCIKVKCVASGVRSQSKVIKGLVFKKHAAHKHMPTECKNPKLLLISGGIGHSASGLSSFDLMEQEKHSLKSCIDVIENCHPNVVLVEKTVSRDVQEFFLNKGMTLVFDMKLHRLERIARHTKSLIFSSGALIVQKLKQCTYLHFEKFTEEHSSICEGGKKPTKTLLFLEGCPARVGCTILLKGSHDDELKKIKSVVRCAFLMAYHLLRETSFLIDQRAMFCTTRFIGSRNTSPTKRSPAASVNCSFSFAKENFMAHSESSFAVDIPILGPDEIGLSVEGNNIPIPRSSLPSSLNKTVCNGKIRTSFPSSTSEYTQYHSDIEVAWSSDEEENPTGLIPFTEDYYVDAEKAEKTETYNEDPTNTESLQELHSVLVLMSSRNSKGIICERSHFSHIKFYKNFDIPLGKFFKDSLLNQRHLCVTCSEPSEVHFYYYAHHSKQLTIQVKKLPSEKCLPGEAEGKLWMWSCCGKCRCEDGAVKSTKRVLVSVTSWTLSFGKFLEIGFSNDNCCRTSTCGHSLQEDFLYFFGLGPMVAMLRYSQMITYAVFTPSHKIEFTNSTGKEWLDKEIENVYKKGLSIFMELDASLALLASKYGDHPLSLGSSFQKFSDVEDLLKKEKLDFEVKVNAVDCSEVKTPSYRLLSLNGLLWELLLLSSLWNHRLSLLSSCFTSPHNLPVLLIPVEGSHDRSEKDDVSQDTSDLQNSTSNRHLGSPQPKPHLSESVWAPLPDIIKQCTDGCPNGRLPRIELSSAASMEIGPGVGRLVEDEGSKSFVRVGREGFTVVDFDDELSSVIACALALQRHHFDTRMVVNLKRENMVGISISSKIEPLMGEEERGGRCDDLDRSTSEGVLPARLDEDHSAHSVLSEDSRLSSFDGLNLLSSLVSPAVDHPEIPIGVGRLAGKVKYSVVCIYAEKFERLRNLCCLSEIDYIASLSRCVNWEAKGGKSKSFFAKTLDGRFIIKGIKRTEMDSFMKFAPDYFLHMKEYFELGNQSCLAKILGSYQVKQMKNGKEVKQDLMVMENLMYGRKVTRQYDLKGALHARFNSAADNGSMDVLLDQNFVNDMNISPFYVSNRGKRLLQRSIWNDTTFLNNINVMDYSLLVGVDVDTGQLSCGIIDYLRQYTWDKQLETWVKSSLVVPKHLMPTVVSPFEYKKRFRKFLSTYFVSVPDNWCAASGEDIN